jgi:type I restriction enzyme R subunit
VPPVKITDASFTEEVEKAGSKRAAASEMEHAARHHIEVHFDEDPARYGKLSEKLGSILSKLQDNWEEQIKALQELVGEIRGPAEDPGGLPESHRPFFGLLEQQFAAQNRQKLIEATVELVEHIAQEVRATGFWATPSYQQVLRNWLVDTIDRLNLEPDGKLAVIESLADKLMELAKHNHASLVR